MCPVVYLSFIFSFLLILFEVTASLTVSFSPSSKVTLREESESTVNFTLADRDAINSVGPDQAYEYEVGIKDDAIAGVKGNKTFTLSTEELRNNYSSYFIVSGKFLGKTSVSITRKSPLIDKLDADKLSDGTRNTLDIIVKRKQTTISLIFTISVAVLVSFNYINMGCALETEVVKSVLRRPVAPALGFLSQYIVMPSVSSSNYHSLPETENWLYQRIHCMYQRIYCMYQRIYLYVSENWLYQTCDLFQVTYLLGYLLLRDWPHLRLGLFVFGCSPAGGASNMWTVLLKGNLDLSVTMTLISTVAAVGTFVFLIHLVITLTLVSILFHQHLSLFLSCICFLCINLLCMCFLCINFSCINFQTGMLPLWMFALGKQIYSGTTTTIPFRNILTTMISMTLCLGIGLLFQRFLPRVARVS